MVIHGKALVMGDHVNTDELHPSQFFSLDRGRVRDGFLQAAAGYERAGRSDLSNRIIVAGENFGCGSSRETGARAFLLAGIRAVVARSLAHIFSRNVRNLGLPALECPALDPLPEDAGLIIRVDEWRLDVPALGKSYAVTPLDPYWEAVLRAGGLLPFLGYGEGREA